MPRLSKKRNIRSKRKSYKKRKVGGRYKKRVRSYSKKRGGSAKQPKTQTQQQTTQSSGNPPPHGMMYMEGPPGSAYVTTK